MFLGHRSKYVVSALALAASASAEAAPRATPRELALKLHERLAGVPLSLKDPRLPQMEARIADGDLSGAAAIATDDPAFYSVTVRNFAAVMSGKDETPYEEFNDFQAMIVGVTRDGADARTLLTGDFTYAGSPGLGLGSPSPSNNVHYKAIEDRRINLKTGLVRVEPQRADLPEAAGLLTSRAWAAAHYEAGTNRRAVEYTFREFLCAPITQWKDSNLWDGRVRRDVDRAPGGNPATYQRLCSTCHAGMDALGGAFARFDFANNRLTYYGPNGVAPKMKQNATVYPEGYEPVDDSWINLSTQNHNQAFGWRGRLEGYGIRAFGEMIANSEGFKDCMTQRVFREVCRREPGAGDRQTLSRLARKFERGGYKLKDLFEETAIQPGCVAPASSPAP